MKLTWKGHPDINLNDAYQKISKIAQFIEDAQERYSNINKIILIQSELKQSKNFNMKLLQPHRFFIKEYILDLQELTHNGHVIRKGRKIIIFNDLILITKILIENIEKGSKKKKKNNNNNNNNSSSNNNENNHHHLPSLSVKKFILLSDVISLNPVVFGCFFILILFILL